MTLLTGMLLLVFIIHIGVLLQWIPYENVWAGKINSVEEMYVYEAISLLLNGVLLLIVYLKKKSIARTSTPIIDTILWIYVVIFGLNSIGNMFAVTLFEKLFGTLFTLTAMYLCWVIVRKSTTSVEDRVL